MPPAPIPELAARRTAAGASAGDGAPAPAAAPVRGGAGRALLEAVRPKQWLKNVLVLAAPAAAGVLATQGVAWRVALAFVAFCLVASGGYLVNDVRDAAADRRHPRKRSRPVADGRLSVGVAVAAAAGLLGAGLLLGWVVAPTFLAALAGYVALTLAYSAWLRHIPVIDLATVAAFFVVRAVAGGLAAGVPLSRWFLIVASFGSLFVVAGKRAGEHAELGVDRAETRRALGHYTLAYLRNVRTLAAGVAVTAYCLWAFEPTAGRAVPALVELSIIPFVLFVLRYAMLVDEDADRAPEDVILGDRGLLAAGAVWLACFAVGVSAG